MKKNYSFFLWQLSFLDLQQLHQLKQQEDQMCSTHPENEIKEK